MSRPLRIEYPNAWYHVMNRGRRGEEVFSEREDYVAFIELLKESTIMWGVRISAFCLMPNHYHILLQTPNANLSRCMRHINGIYTQRYNRRHHLDGQLFRGRYKSILIGEDSYMLELVRYIHRNPLDAGLIEKMEKYPWNSHRGYLSRSKKWDWLYKGFILSMFSKDKNKALRLYREFISKEEPEDTRSIFSLKKLPSILGSESFIEKIRDKFSHSKREQEVPESQLLSPDKGKIKAAVCEAYKVGPEDLKVMRRGRFNEPRNVAIYLMRHLTGESLESIGMEFNISSYSTVSSVFASIKSKVIVDKKLKKRIEKIESKLR